MFIIKRTSTKWCWIKVERIIYSLSEWMGIIMGMSVEINYYLWADITKVSSIFNHDTNFDIHKMLYFHRWLIYNDTTFYLNVDKYTVTSIKGLEFLEEYPDFDLIRPILHSLKYRIFIESLVDIFCNYLHAVNWSDHLIYRIGEWELCEWCFMMENYWHGQRPMKNLRELWGVWIAYPYCDPSGRV